MSEDTQAHDLLLRLCRASTRTHKGYLVMRKLPDETCVVLDLSKGEPVPGGDGWETRPVRVAEGNSWVTCMLSLDTDKLHSWQRIAWGEILAQAPLLNCGHHKLGSPPFELYLVRA